MGTHSPEKSAKTIAAVSARTAVPAGFAIAWLFVVFLSATLYRNSADVGSATLSTVFCSIFFFAASALALGFFNTQKLSEHKRKLHGAGLAVLTGASVLFPLRGFVGISDWAALAVFGLLAGIGLALVVLFYVSVLSTMSFAAVVSWYLISLTAGVGLFFLYMIAVPTDLVASFFWLLPVLSAGLSFALSRNRLERQSMFSTYARSLAQSQLRAMFDHRAFPYFIVVSGFLFGYCYNVYPKSTRFAGVYTEAAFGLVSLAAVALLVVCLAVVGVLILVGRLAKRKSAYVLGSMLLVALAVMYFCLPNMPSSWMLFVMLDGAAVSTALFALLGVLLRFSLGDAKRFRQFFLLLAGSVVAGASIAALFIETTIPDPMIVVPEFLRDAVIVGTPAIGFIILALMFFLLSQNAFFPAATGAQPDAIGVSDIHAAREVIAERFSLTPREEEILGMLLLGRSGPYISEDLYLSKSTVKTHIRHIYDKTGVSSRQQLIDLAHGMREGESGK